MKKKYFTVLFLVFVLLAIVLTSDPSIKAVKKIFVSKYVPKKDDRIVIVIDPGHPRTCIGKES